MQFELFDVMLSERRDEYTKKYPKTATEDFRIVEALLSGKSVTQVAQMVYYEQSNIYRVIKRIKKFLSETPVEELDLNTIPCYMPESVYSWPTKNFSFVGFHVSDKLIALCQLGRSSIRGSELAKYHPSLRYVQRRDEILDEMRGYELIVRSENDRHVQVFEYVEYIKHHYVFKLTKEAAHYLGL